MNMLNPHLIPMKVGLGLVKVTRTDVNRRMPFAHRHRRHAGDHRVRTLVTVSVTVTVPRTDGLGQTPRHSGSVTRTVRVPASL
eukprot:1655413-Rhodomonas_salina.1